MRACPGIVHQLGGVPHGDSHGNTHILDVPCPWHARHYRKTLLARMGQLNYLDDSPCFPKDRRLAVAFVEGGLDAERAMRDQIRCTEGCQHLQQPHVQTAVLEQRAALHRGLWERAVRGSCPGIAAVHVTLARW
jgi:hypothetical protein